jgi:pimeloyl-ACP methyl ester carboxylesterase
MKGLWRDHELMRGVEVDGMLADYDGRDLLVPEGPAGLLAGALDAVEAPALIVTGREDTAWRRLVGDALAYGLPNGRRARLPGGHLCNLSHPEPYNDLIAAFAGELAA